MLESFKFFSPRAELCCKVRVWLSSAETITGATAGDQGPSEGTSTGVWVRSWSTIHLSCWLVSCIRTSRDIIEKCFKQCIFSASTFGLCVIYLTYLLTFVYFTHFTFVYFTLCLFISLYICLFRFTFVYFTVHLFLSLYDCVFHFTFVYFMLRFLSFYDLWFLLWKTREKSLAVIIYWWSDSEMLLLRFVGENLLETQNFCHFSCGTVTWAKAAALSLGLKIWPDVQSGLVNTKSLGMCLRRQHLN